MVVQHKANAKGGAVFGAALLRPRLRARLIKVFQEKGESQERGHFRRRDTSQAPPPPPKLPCHIRPTARPRTIRATAGEARPSTASLANK